MKNYKNKRYGRLFECFKSPRIVRFIEINEL